MKSMDMLIVKFQALVWGLAVIICAGLMQSSALSFHLDESWIIVSSSADNYLSIAVIAIVVVQQTVE